MDKMQKKYCFGARLVGPVSTKTKEWFIGRHLWIRCGYLVLVKFVCYLSFWFIRNVVAFESSAKVRFSISCNLKAVKLPWHCPIWSSPLMLSGFACCCCWCCCCCCYCCGFFSEYNCKWFNCHLRKHLKGSEQGEKKCWRADSEGNGQRKRWQMSIRKIRVGSVYIWHAAWLSWSFNWDA